MTVSEDRRDVTMEPRLGVRGLFAWGVSLLVAGTLVTMYGADLAHAVAGIGDRLSQAVADFLVTLARLAIAPAGAMITTLAIVVRVTKSEPAQR